MEGWERVWVVRYGLFNACQIINLTYAERMTNRTLSSATVLFLLLGGVLGIFFWAAAVDRLRKAPDVPGHWLLSNARLARAGLIGLVVPIVGVLVLGIIFPDSPIVETLANAAITAEGVLLFWVPFRLRKLPDAPKSTT